MQKLHSFTYQYFIGDCVVLAEHIVGLVTGKTRTLTLEALDIDDADAIELEGDTLTLLVTVRSCSRRALLSEGNASLDDLSQI